MSGLGGSRFGRSSFDGRGVRKRSRRAELKPFGGPAEVLEERTLLAAAGGDVAPATATAVEAAAGQELLTLELKPLDIDLLGLRITSDPIVVSIAAEAGDGKLLGNLLGTVSSLVNLQEVNAALNNVLGTTIDLVNSVDLQVGGVGSGIFSTGEAGITEILELYVAPVQLDLLGADVTTSPIRLTVSAEAGEGKVLGNVLTALTDLFNPDPGTGEVPELNLDTVITNLNGLLADLNAQIPGIAAATVPTRPFAQGDVLSLTVPQIDLDLLGLVLQTTPITVDARATSGDGKLLGNVLTSVLNTLDATPAQLHDLSDSLNGLLAKVVGVLNASELVLPGGALDSLSETLKTLALPNLVTAESGAQTTVLDLVIASSDGATPPVMVDLLGLEVTTSNIDAVLLAKTGDGKVLGNLVYNVANLLNPGGSAGLFGLITDLATGTSSGTPTGSALDKTAGSTGPTTEVLTLTLPPLDVNLLGLEIDSSVITVTVSAETGDGNLLGNAVGGLTTLIDTEQVSAAVNNVLGSVVSLVNSAGLQVTGVLDGVFTSPAGTVTNNVTDILELIVAPVRLDLLGVIVETGPITLKVAARSGSGLILGNVLTSLTDLFNPPLPEELDLAFINARLNELLADLEEQAPGIPSAEVPPPVITDDRILSLTLPALDLNLLGLMLATEPITVNADATSGDGLLLGNVLTAVLNTLDATPEQLTELSANLNALVGKVFGVLNASTLVLPAGALDTLTGPLATLADPFLVSAAPGATTTILDLSIASTDGTTPPVRVDVLGLTVTTSNIDAVLSAQTGEGQILGNLLYNVANLLNSGSPASLLLLLNGLSTPEAAPPASPADDLIGYHNGTWQVAISTGSAFDSRVWSTWQNLPWDALVQGDFDGDGRTDVLGLLDGLWQVGLARGTGGAATFATTLWGKWENLDWRDVTAGDLNGDGKDDILARLGGQWHAALSGGTAFGGRTRWGTWHAAPWTAVALTDLDGDGDDDLLANSAGQWHAGLSTGSAFAMRALWSPWANLAWQALGTADFNADGKADVYGLYRGTWQVGLSTGAGFATSLFSRWMDLDWKDPRVGDFDGDGKADVAARYRGLWQVTLATGATNVWEAWPDEDWKDVRVGDFNGDGKDDLVARRPGGNLRVARSTGTAFVSAGWGRWADVPWRAVAAADAGPAPIAVPAGSASASPRVASARVSSSPAAAAPAARAVADEDEALTRFWAASDEDEKFAGGLVSAVR